MTTLRRCHDCAKPALPGQPRCNACRVKVKRQENLEQGLCFCGRSVVPNRSLCQRCQSRLRQHETETRRARRERGQCWMCAEPASPGRTQCPYHLAKARAYANRTYAKLKEKIVREVTCGACKRRLSLYWWGKECPYCQATEETP